MFSWFSFLGEKFRRQNIGSSNTPKVYIAIAFCRLGRKMVINHESILMAFFHNIQGVNKAKRSMIYEEWITHIQSPLVMDSVFANSSSY